MRHTPRRQPATTHTRAYTLVEVLIVVTLLGIAAAAVIPAMGSTDILRVQSAVRTLVSDITFAQSDALARQQGRAVVFDIDANVYRIVEVKGEVLNIDDDTIFMTDFNNSRRFHDAKLASAAFDGDAVLIFDEFGAPVQTLGGNQPGNGGLVTVTGSGSLFEVNVEPYTGRVTVRRSGG